MSFLNKFIDKAKHHGSQQHNKEKDFQNIQNIQQTPNFQVPLSPTTQADSIAVTTTTINTQNKHQTQNQPQNPQPNTSLPESSSSSVTSSPTKLNQQSSEPSMSTTSHMPMSPPSSTQNSFSLGVDNNNLNGARPDIRDMSIDGSDTPHHSASSTVAQIASPPSMPLPPAPPQVAQPAQVQVKSPQKSQQSSQYAHPAMPAKPQAQFIPVMPLTPQSPPLTPTLPHTSSSSHDSPSTHVSAINIPATVSTLPAPQPKPQRPKLKLADFSLLRTLGTGSFGRVHLAQSKVNQRFYAIKVLKKSEVVRLKQVEHTNNEKAILERVQHPFLVNLWGTFQDDSNLYMVMDYVPGGELFSVLRKSQRFPDHVAKFYAAEVLLAISYLHSKDIIYRDLKPENLLLDAGGHIKITDFGFAKHVPDITWTLCGTPDYLAPEIIQSKGYGKAVDWYSLGVLIFEMLAGYPPFYDDDHLKLYEKILVGKIKWPSYFDPNAKDLLKRLLTPDLSKRYGNLKGGVDDIKRHKWFEGVDFNKVVRREIRAPYVPTIRGEGDASHFDRYPEETEPYGQAAPDLFREKFADF